MAKLDQHVVQLGRMIQEIFLRFQCSHRSISQGPHTVLSHHELFLLETLGGTGSTKMKDAALRLGIAFNTLTGIVDQLENRGFVSRTRSQADRRVVFLELTSEGKKIYKSASKAKYEFHRATLASLSVPERKTLLDLFQKMAGVQTPPELSNNLKPAKAKKSE